MITLANKPFAGEYIFIY